MEDEVVSTIELASSICTQRSFRDLMRNMRVALPKFFGFEGLGILLRDLKTDDLYTISENTEKHGEEEMPGDEYRKGTIIRFPSSIGITGHVFMNKQLCYSNRANKDTKFS
jgi:hypothetical protein